MNPAQLHSLNEHVQLWAARQNVDAVDVAGALVEMASDNAVNNGIRRTQWRDQCAEAFDRSVRRVRVGDPARG